MTPLAMPKHLASPFASWTAPAKRQRRRRFRSHAPAPSPCGPAPARKRRDAPLPGTPADRTGGIAACRQLRKNLRRQDSSFPTGPSPAMLSRVSLKVSDQVTVQIQDLAFGGEGVGRLDDFVMFVPFVIVGETVLAEIERGVRP